MAGVADVVVDVFGDDGDVALGGVGCVCGVGVVDGAQGQLVVVGCEVA